jgi:hypothetical protein
MNCCDKISHRGRKPVTFSRLCLSGLSVLVAATLVVSCGRKDDRAPAPVPVQAAGTNSASAAPRLDFAKLAGKWERPDGGYVLEIKSVDASGTMVAAYFNPDPINVARAAALHQDGATKVMVELRDQNYPGCTYSLTYDPEHDQLYGQYFQAAMQRTYEVTFARMK